MRDPRLLVLETEAVTAMSAVVGALDLALESLAYSDARRAPTADQLGIAAPCAGDLQEQIVDALGSSTPPPALRRLSALLAVVSSMERIAVHCAAIADLVPDLAPALSDDRATRRAVELAGVQTRARLVAARDALQAWATSWGPKTPSGWMAADAGGGLPALAAMAARLPHASQMAAALPLLVEHLGHIDDEAEEIAERSWRSRSRWARSSASAELEVPLGIGSGTVPVSAGSP